MQYGCVYGGTANADGGAMGASTNDVIYPMMRHRDFCATTMLDVETYPDWPAPFPCSERAVGARAPVVGEVCPPNGANANTVIQYYCEQGPIAGSGVAEITEKISGGADYEAKMKTIGNGGGTDGGVNMFPGPLYIISVTSGTTDITAFGPDLVTGGNGLSFADGKIPPRT
jgi:hypothetical protein